MTVPFGFSVGDFIAAIGLVAKITEALQDSGGAASEYQSLTRDLANLQATLLKIDSAQAGNNNLIAGNIYDQTSVVRQSAQELLDGLSKFEKKLGEQAKKGWKYGTGRKIQWAALQSKEITKAKNIIHNQVQNLSLLSLLQILEVVQKLDQSQRDFSQTVLNKIDESKSEVQESVTQLSSAKDAQFENMISELKSSLEVLRSSMQTRCADSVAQIQLLEDSIQGVLDRVTVSSSRVHQIIDQEREGFKAELSRLCGSVEEIRSAVAEKFQPSLVEMQLSTLDIRDTVIRASETVIESHNKVVREVAQGLEARIIDNFTSALDQFGNEKKRRRIRYTDSLHKTDHKFDSDTGSGCLLVPRNGNASTTKAFFESCLAKILEVLNIALRRIWLILSWLLPLVAGFVAHLSQNIPRQFPQLLENSIRFEDALGRVDFLPYKYFQHWEMFQTMLQYRFQELPGESNVKAGLYFILRAGRPDHVITPDIWKRSVMPGAKINMSILLAGITSSESCCPRCKSRCTTKSMTVKCQECELEYCSSSKADLEKRQDKIAKRFLKLIGLGASHVDSNTDTIIDASLSRRAGRVKVTPRKKFGDDGNEDYNSQNRPNQTKNIQFRVKNNAQDIEAFKRIHTLTEEKRCQNLDQNSGSIWNTSPQEERERVKKFWLRLGPKEILSLIKEDKNAVLKKMKEQRKHLCSCQVCCRKRTEVDQELEILYDSYYEELVQRFNHYDEADDEAEEDSQPFRRLLFNFGYTLQSIVLKSSEDDLKFQCRMSIEMMEQITELRMVREEDLAREQFINPNSGYAQHSPTSYESPSGNKRDDEDGEDIEQEYDSGNDELEDDEVDKLPEDKCMEEGHRIFRIVAARMFERRFVTALEEKINHERQAKLIGEGKEEERTALTDSSNNSRK